MAWAPKGAWAQQVEKDDDAEAPAPPPEAFPALSDLGAKLDQAFPTLGETKDKKVSKKKQKGQVLSLSEFNAGAASSIGGGGGGGGAYRPVGARAVDLDSIQLPTGPRARAEGEEDDRRPGLGGGFRSEFGGDRGGREERGARQPPPRFALSSAPSTRASAHQLTGAFDSSGGYGRDDRDGPRRGGYDRDDRGGRDREDMGPSRADTGDWSKRSGFQPSGDGPRFRDRDDRDERRPPREDLGPSRADEVRSISAAEALPRSDHQRWDQCCCCLPARSSFQAHEPLGANHFFGALAEKPARLPARQLGNAPWVASLPRAAQSGSTSA